MKKRFLTLLLVVLANFTFGQERFNKGLKLPNAIQKTTFDDGYNLIPLIKNNNGKLINAFMSSEDLKTLLSDKSNTYTKTEVDELVNTSNLVPYNGAVNTIDVNEQEIRGFNSSYEMNYNLSALALNYSREDSWDFPPGTTRFDFDGLHFERINDSWGSLTFNPGDGTLNFSSILDYGFNPQVVITDVTKKKKSNFKPIGVTTLTSVDRCIFLDFSDNKLKFWDGTTAHLLY